MGPPVERAIELLKIHQMRRENTVIYQGIQDVQAGITGLKDELGNVHRVAQAAYDVAHTARDIARKASEDISSIRRDLSNNEVLNELRQEMTALRGRFERASTKETIRAAALFEKTNRIETELSHIVEQQQSDSVALVTTSNELKQVGMGFQLLSQLQERLQGLEENVNLLCPGEAAAEGVPGEGHEQPLPEVCVARPQQSILVNRTQDDSNDLLLTLNNEADLAESADMGSIDLDRNVATDSFVVNAQKQAVTKDSLVMIPNSVDDTQPAAAGLGSLQQRPHQSLASYLVEAQCVIDTSPSLIHGSALTLFVNGLGTEAHRLECRTWLDRCGWTWDAVIDFVNAACHERQMISTSMSDVSVVGVDNEAATSIDNARHTTKEKHHPSKKARITETSKKVGSEPRRSQRLIDQETRSACTPSVPSDQNTGHLVPRRDAAPEMLSQRKPESRACKQKNEASKPKPTRANKPAWSRERDEKGRWRSQGTAGPRSPNAATKTAQSIVEVLGTDADQLSWARTPEKQVVVERSVDAHIRVADEGRQRAPQRKSRRTVTNAQGSPIPIVGTIEKAVVLPRLVPAKRSRAEAFDKTNNEEVLLPRQPRTPQRDTSRPQGLKRREPLQPPPEIPILSTSDEDNTGRWDRWDSPEPA